MDISAIASVGATYPPVIPGSAKQSVADFQSLAQALDSGDLASAQQAFATLQQDSPQVSRAVSSATSGGTAASNPVAAAWQTLSQDLQSGDLGGAQQAFAALQKAMHGGHHGHHHGPASVAASAPSQPQAAPVPATGVDTLA